MKFSTANLGLEGVANVDAKGSLPAILCPFSCGLSGGKWSDLATTYWRSSRRAPRNGAPPDPSSDKLAGPWGKRSFRCRRSVGAHRGTALHPIRRAMSSRDLGTSEVFDAGSQSARTAERRSARSVNDRLVGSLGERGFEAGGWPGAHHRRESLYSFYRVELGRNGSRRRRQEAAGTRDSHD